MKKFIVGLLITMVIALIFGLISLYESGTFLHGFFFMGQITLGAFMLLWLLLGIKKIMATGFRIMGIK